MKWFYTVLLTICFNVPMMLFACPVCEKSQPKALQGISHGSGPEGNLDYVIIICAVLIVGVTLGLSLKLLIWPKEKSDDHVKNIVLQ